MIIDKPEAEVNNCSGGPSDPVRGPTVGGVARTMAAIGFCKLVLVRGSLGGTVRKVVDTVADMEV